MNVLAISYGRNLFNALNPERKRQHECASVVESLHIIVFARSKENLTPVQDGNLFVYPTGGNTKIGMLIRGFFLGQKLLQQHKHKEFIITTQDPFEAGMVGYALARLFNLPLNIQEHGDFFSTTHWRQETILNRLRYYLGLFLLSRAHTVRVVSKRIKNTLIQKGIVEDKIRELSVAVPINKFLEAPASPVARDLFAPESIIMLSVARFVSQKNLPLLIHAFARAYKNEPRLRLLLIGEGPEKLKLAQMITKLFPHNNSELVIKIIPWTNDVPGYMKSVDLYALSSNYEGYARVLPEAMASGLPIVTTSVGCVGEVCLPKEHALVVPIDDTTAFADALLVLAHDTELQQRFKQKSVSTMEFLTNGHDYPTRWLKAL